MGKTLDNCLIEEPNLKECLQCPYFEYEEYYDGEEEMCFYICLRGKNEADTKT